MNRNSHLFTALGLCLASAGLFATAQSDSFRHHSGAITRKERISAQTQIERVYYNHRIWPKENQALKPPFEQLVPAALIEKKALEPLRMSAALKQCSGIQSAHMLSSVQWQTAKQI